MKPLLFIYNPAAGTCQISDDLPELIDIMTKAGWLVTAYPTQKAGDAAEIARTMAAHYERVVCAGGDGTLSETVAGLLQVENPPPLGYIPAGSTNDTAQTLAIPKDALQAATVAAGDGIARPTDIGTLNGQSFVYVAAFGAFTQVAYSTPQDMKNTFGHLAYIVEGIASLPSIAPYHLKVEYDGKALEDDFYFGMVTNTVSVAGLRHPSREQVVLDDGLFEVDLIKKPVSLADITNGLQALLDKHPVSAGSRVHLQASHIVFTSTRPVPWTVDGEFGGEHLVSEIVNLSGRLNIIQGASG